MKAREDKRMVKLKKERNFKATLLGIIFFKPTHSLLGTKCESRTTYKRPSSMIRLHGPWCRPMLDQYQNFAIPT